MAGPRSLGNAASVAAALALPAAASGATDTPVMRLFRKYRAVYAPFGELPLDLPAGDQPEQRFYEHLDGITARMLAAPSTCAAKVIVDTCFGGSIAHGEPAPSGSRLGRSQALSTSPRATRPAVRQM